MYNSINAHYHPPPLIPRRVTAAAISRRELTSRSHVAISRRELTSRAHVAISRRELTSRAHVASSRCELIAVGLLLHVAAWGVGWGVGVAPERIRIDLRRPRRLEPCAARPHACHHLVRVGVGWELDGSWMGVGARAGWRFTRGLWLGLGAGLGRLGMRLE
jgi:hypothetical protein